MEILSHEQCTFSAGAFGTSCKSTPSLTTHHFSTNIAIKYSPSYYRATWIITGLDAGFATAMTVRPKWLRDLCSVLFSIYYIIYANEADEKVWEAYVLPINCSLTETDHQLRKYRAVPTVEMLRATWEKTTNPYVSVIPYCQFQYSSQIGVASTLHISTSDYGPAKAYFAATSRFYLSASYNSLVILFSSGTSTLQIK